METNRIDRVFFEQDILDLAPVLPGKILVRKFPDGHLEEWMITEVEAYRGGEDLACHASKGKTQRNSIMYEKGGLVYVYLIYGMHWMLNIVSGHIDQPQAALIRGLKNLYGPGRLTKKLEIGKDFYGEDLCHSERMWLKERPSGGRVLAGPRIGVDYAGEYWKNIPWRFYLETESS